jgi:hypothetical protein
MSGKTSRREIGHQRRTIHTLDDACSGQRSLFCSLASSVTSYTSVDGSVTRFFMHSIPRLYTCNLMTSTGPSLQPQQHLTPTCLQEPIAGLSTARKVVMNVSAFLFNRTPVSRSSCVLHQDLQGNRLLMNAAQVRLTSVINTFTYSLAYLCTPHRIELVGTPVLSLTQLNTLGWVSDLTGGFQQPRSQPAWMIECNASKNE